ncbi:protein-glutamate O-methyltransferase [Albimonas sp. CAU 1670]|uniref:CheR family methyltransferase n=1 Tax=Albimonas sp. CAU 1670 TaxID=3032599 RepID=UPI0023D98A29|nr:protein-glutamate O-methyltransferase [Albimonas sp. CAU 1670]MDF2231124.1 protein-glutamate O-methyltransferase [Albimonas sp. CAU 1670]
MSDAEFNRITAKVFEIAGIVLKDHKRQMVYTRLSRRLRATGLTSFGQYMDLIDRPEGAGELVQFTNAVTTNLTSFFREGHHFTHLREHVLEPLAKSGKTRLRVWSAGCSTGEEPYSIALTARAAARSMASVDFRILATDLDTNVLATGKAGVYPEARAADIPAELRSGALAKSGDRVEFSSQVRAMIAFRKLNLLHPWPFRGPFDAIFCRNVLIYFDAETKAGLVRRFAEALTDDGILYLGHSESLLGEHPLLRSEGRTIYRRRR